MFGSIHQCQQLLSVVNGNKSHGRNCITNAFVELVLKVVSAYNFFLEVGKIVAEKRYQVSGRKQ